MNLKGLLTELKETDAVDAVQPGWDESVASMPGDLPEFLRPEQVRANCAYGGFEPEAEPKIQAAARRIAASPALRLLAWHCFQRLPTGDNFRNWPSLASSLSAEAGLFYVLVGLGLIRPIRRLHGTMGVPEQITRDTCRMIRCMTENYGRTFPGRLGMARRHLNWCRHHLAGKIFRIGRMEYMFGAFNGEMEAYRNNRTGQVVALVCDEVRLDGEGYIRQADAGEDGPDDWTATLTADDRFVVGYPISPLGQAIRRRVRLKPDLYHRVLGKGDPVLDLHIPEGGGMSPEICGESMAAAIGFFRKFFPDKPFGAIASMSWIFNPRLERILPAGSNLVRYLRELYLYPFRSEPWEGMYYVFGIDEMNDLAAAPRDTSLQRAILEFLEAGNRWGGGEGMFFMTDDIERFGRQPYRSQWSIEDMEIAVCDR